jgi:hypothetical protein
MFLKKFFKYSDGTKIKFTDKFFDKFEDYNDVYFLYQGVEDICLRDDVENEYVLLDELLRDYTYEDYFSCFDTSDDHAVMMTHDEYRDHIASSVYDINADDIYHEDFNQTNFYDLLVQHDYIKELN